MSQINIVNGDLLKQPVDTIVNAANSHLAHGGGLALAIAKSAVGPQMKNPGMDEREWFSRDRTSPEGVAWLKEQKDHPLIPTGGAGWTGAGFLPFKFIVHAVGPVWGGGQYCEKRLVLSAYTHALVTAWALGCRSVAVPAISAGIFGVPMEIVATQAFRAIRNVQAMIPLDVTVCLTNDADVALWQEIQREG